MSTGCTQRKKDRTDLSKNIKSCNDACWICLFIVFWAVLITIAYFSIMHGNYLATINGYDSFGNICGVKHNKHFDNFSFSAKDTSTKSYVFFFAPLTPSKGIKICVEQCPWTDMYAPEDICEHGETIGSQLCRYDFDMKLLMNVPMYVHYSNPLGPCPGDVVDSSIPIRQRCINSIPYESPAAMLSDISSGGGITQLSFVYIYLGRYYIAALCGVAFVLSVFLVIMIRWLAKFIPKLICIFFLIANVCLCAVLWHAYKNMPIFDPKKRGSEVEIQLMKEFILNKSFVYYFAILDSVTMGVLAFAIFFRRRKITSTSVLFEEALNCLSKIPSLLTVTLMSLGILIAYLWFWGFVTICITTATYPDVFPFVNVSKFSPWDINKFVDTNRPFQKIEYVKNESIRKCFWLFIAGFLWTTEFISSCEQFVLGAVIAHRYFERPLPSPITSVAKTLFKYHLGTVARGSLLFTLFRIPRLIFLNSNGKLTAGCERFAFLRTMFGFMERYLGILKSNAYTVAAMETIDLDSAVKIARRIMVNAQELKSINHTGHIVLFFGKVFVAIVIGLIGLFLLRTDEDLYFYMAPLLLSTAFAYLIAHTVLSLFEVIMDSLVLCACEDKRLNGNAGHWAQSRLSKFLSSEFIGNNKIRVHVVEVAEGSTVERLPFKSKINILTL